MLHEISLMLAVEKHTLTRLVPPSHDDKHDPEANRLWLRAVWTRFNLDFPFYFQVVMNDADARSMGGGFDDRLPLSP